MITSSQNTKLKLVRSLQGRAKERREAGAFLAEGVRLLEEALAAEWSFRFVLAAPELSERGAELVVKLQEKGVEVEKVSAALLAELSETETSQGLLAVLELPRLDPPDLDALDFVFIPDQVRDPGNLGTLIRSAAAAGAQVVFIPPETVDAYSPKVVRAGMGAHFQVPIYTLDWHTIHTYLVGIKVFLADAEAPASLWSVDFRQPLALIIGGEADGASESARKLADMLVNIPMPGKIESLNAAVAGTVLMFEIVRQRKL